MTGDIKLPQFVLWWTVNLSRVYSCLPPTPATNPLFQLHLSFFLSQESDRQPHLIFGCVWSGPVREAPPSPPQVEWKKQSDLRSGPDCIWSQHSVSLWSLGLCLKQRPRSPDHYGLASSMKLSWIPVPILLYLMTSPDSRFWRTGGYNLFMSSMVNPAERDVPGNVIDLDLGFFHYLQSRKMTSLTSVPEQQRLPTALCRITIRQNDANDLQWIKLALKQITRVLMREYHSWKISVRSRTSCWMLAAWDRACVASCFSSLAWPETSTRRLERLRATWTRLHAAELSRIHTPSCNVMPFVIFNLSESGFGGGHDGDTGTDYNITGTGRKRYTASFRKCSQ